MDGRREFHPDAPPVEQLVADPPRIADVTTHRVDVASAGAWVDAERLWERFLGNGTRWPAFRLVRNGVTLPRSRFSRSASVGRQVDDLAEPNRVLERYSDAATVVLQALQFSDRELAKLSTNFALDLNQPIQVNAYLSPLAARGLDVHFDFHDVVVVQLAGVKRWRVWEQLERPARPLKRGRVISRPEAHELGEPLLDRVLGAGDCLAIPCGFPRTAETVDQKSAHLTIGVMALTWSRFLRRRIDAIASNTALANHIVIDGAHDERAPTAASAAASAAIADGIDDHELRVAATEDVWRRQPQTRLRPRRPPTLTADDLVRVTPAPLLWIDTSANGHRRSLVLGDCRLRFPKSCLGFVAVVLRCDRVFSAADLDGSLDGASPLVVLQRLAVEGVAARA